MMTTDKKKRLDIEDAELTTDWLKVGAAVVAGVMVYGGIATVYRAMVSAYMYTSAQLQLLTDKAGSVFEGVDLRLVGIVFLTILVVTSKKS